MFLTVNKDVLTMLMTSLARDASALGSIEVEVEVEGCFFCGSIMILLSCICYAFVHLCLLMPCGHCWDLLALVCDV